MFVLGKLFQLSLMLAGKSRAYKSETSFKCYTVGQAPDLWVRPELPRVKHLSSAALLGRLLTFLTDIRLGW
jgi:hypothetical protein